MANLMCYSRIHSLTFRGIVLRRSGCVQNAFTQARIKKKQKKVHEQVWDWRRQRPFMNIDFVIETTGNKYHGGTSDATTSSALIYHYYHHCCCCYCCCRSFEVFPQKQRFLSFENNTGQTDGRTDGRTDTTSYKYA